MQDGVSITLDQLLYLFLTEGDYNQRRFHDQATRYARAITSRACRALPEDLHEEIWNQALYALWSDRVAVVASRRPMRACFRAALFAAIRTVRSAYAAPGQRTRHSSVARQSAQVAAEDVGRLLEPGEYERCLVQAGDTWEFDPDRVASPEAARAIKQVEDDLTVDAVLSKAPPLVSTGLRLIHLHEEPVEDVASLLDVSRFALHRQIAKFTAGWRAAA